MKLTKEKLAEMLNCNEYGDEITNEQEQQAKDSGLVVVFGYSDDNMEFRGALDDEFGCYDGREIWFTKIGLEIDDDDMEVIKKYDLEPKLNCIEAVWDEGYDTGEGDETCSWQYKTDIPHSTFRIMEGGDLYCIGIVFDINDLN